LGALATRVATARLLVCGDTGVAHLATAYRTPSVLLFGPTAPRHWGPAVDPDLHIVLWHGDDGHLGDPHGAAVDPALEMITVAEVLAAAASLLADRS
jgi:ADP-heptose:LPS heptosyltransferase